MLTAKLETPLLKIGIAVSTAILCLFVNAVQAYDGKPAPKVASEQPKELEGVGIDEKLGSKIDFNTLVKDEFGNTVKIGSFFDGKHPVILSPVYFTCPGLCNFHLNGLTEALKVMDKTWSIGDKYQVIAMSFDSKDTPEQASKKKQVYLSLYDRPEAAKGWHFLTADEPTVQALMASLGFKFKWDDNLKEWAHASAAIVITPDGTISRYLPGILFNQQDIKLALNEATEGKIGSVVDKMVLFCFRYDPHQSKYTLAAFNVMKLGGAVMVLVMMLWLLPIYVRSRRAKNKEAGR